MAVGPRVDLRVDANRGWTLEEALRFGWAVVEGGVRLAFIEEPTQESGDWGALYDETGDPEVRGLGRLV